MAQLFQRLVRAHEYKQAPRDLLLPRDGKITSTAGISLPLSRPIVESYEELLSHPGAAYISCGDSAGIDLPDGSVDLAVTDPPYVGKVHYSELADFFHAWLRELRPFPSYPHRRESTRCRHEVQSTSARSFGKGLTRVWKEVSRVLRDDGVLVFSFHQTDTKGWQEVMTALREAGLLVTAVQPVMAEMTTSVAKSGASAPSNLDALIVCRKPPTGVPWAQSPSEASSKAMRALRALRKAGIAFTSADIMSVVAGSVLSLLTSPLLDGQLDGLLAKADAKSAAAVAALNPREPNDRR
jgi:adenine-specific DNA methylase